MYSDSMMIGRRPRPMRGAVDAEYWINRSSFKPVFWRNPMDTCSTNCLLYAFLVFKEDVLKDIIAADEKSAVMAPSLQRIMEDSKMKVSWGNRIDPDHNLNMKLEEMGVWELVETVVEGGKDAARTAKIYVKPSGMPTTVAAIFDELNPLKWGDRFFASVDIDHTAADVSNFLKTKPSFFVKVGRLPLNNIDLLVDGVKGKICFVVGVGLQKTTGTNIYHAITLVYDSDVKKGFLRCSNGYLRFLKTVKVDKSLTEFKEEQYRVVSACIRFVSASIDSAHSTKDIEDIHRPLTSSAAECILLGADDSEQSSGTEENGHERIRRDGSRIAFVTVPRLNLEPAPDQVTIVISADCEKKKLKWTGTKINGEYFCRNPRAGQKCPRKQLGLKMTSTEAEIKDFLKTHARCHKGTVPGERTGEFPY